MQLGHEGTAATLSQALSSTVRGAVRSEGVKSAASVPRGFRLERHSPALPPIIQRGKAITRLTSRSDWGSGYGADVQMRNLQTVPLLWQVSCKVSDSITTLWDARVHAPRPTAHRNRRYLERPVAPWTIDNFRLLRDAPAIRLACSMVCRINEAARTLLHGDSGSPAGC
jgi:hypothetical protein